MIDTVKPGDKVQIIGILRPKSHVGTSNTGGFDKYFLAYGVESLTSVSNTVIFLP